MRTRVETATSPCPHIKRNGYIDEVDTTLLAQPDALASLVGDDEGDEYEAAQHVVQVDQGGVRDPRQVLGHHV
jgi:hypothetical protein